jgi:hypothetical protein
MVQVESEDVEQSETVSRWIPRSGGKCYKRMLLINSNQKTPVTPSGDQIVGGR